jgi:hypothetical protein
MSLERPMFDTRKLGKAFDGVMLNKTIQRLLAKGILYMTTGATTTASGNHQVFTTVPRDALNAVR